MHFRIIDMGCNAWMVTVSERNVLNYVLGLHRPTRPAPAQGSWWKRRLSYVVGPKIISEHLGRVSIIEFQILYIYNIRLGRIMTIPDSLYRQYLNKSYHYDVFSPCLLLQIGEEVLLNSKEASTTPWLASMTQKIVVGVKDYNLAISSLNVPGKNTYNILWSPRQSTCHTLVLPLVCKETLTWFGCA